eukprot:GDKJ01052082.1.p1 GENE.GDKJ01052082.1~~GDKJ01052082.1.p1  ORF type:complete len:699 (+),score=156.71 GDKJ01052082.1:31-2127(+)
MSDLDDLADQLDQFLASNTSNDDLVPNVPTCSYDFKSLTVSCQILVLRFLDFKDVVKIGQVSHFFYELSRKDDIWRPLCDIHFPNITCSNNIKKKNPDFRDRRNLWMHTFSALYASGVHFSTLCPTKSEIKPTMKKCREYKVINTQTVEEMAANASQEMALMATALKLQSEMSNSFVDTQSLCLDRYSMLYSGHIPMHKAIKLISKADRKTILERQNQQSIVSPIESHSNCFEQNVKSGFHFSFIGESHKKNSQKRSLTQEQQEQQEQQSSHANQETPVIVNLSDLPLLSSPLDKKQFSSSSFLPSSIVGECAKLKSRASVLLVQKQQDHSSPTQRRRDAQHDLQPFSVQNGENVGRLIKADFSIMHMTQSLSNNSKNPNLQRVTTSVTVNKTSCTSSNDMFAILAIVREWRRRREFSLSTTEESNEFLLSLSKQGANEHFCFGNKCKLDHIGGVILCRHTGNWHVCGRRCERAINDENGLFVCPTSGQCFDQMTTEIDHIDGIIGKYCDAEDANEEMMKFAGLKPHEEEAENNLLLTNKLEKASQGVRKKRDSLSSQEMHECEATCLIPRKVIKEGNEFSRKNDYVFDMQNPSSSSEIEQEEEESEFKMFKRSKRRKTKKEDRSEGDEDDVQDEKRVFEEDFNSEEEEDKIILNLAECSKKKVIVSAADEVRLKRFAALQAEAEGLELFDLNERPDW